MPEAPPGWHWEEDEDGLKLVKDEPKPEDVVIQCQGSITLPSIGK